jgi:hypothetical protein
MRRVVVLGDHIAESNVGMPGGALLVQENLLRPCLQIDDPVILAVAVVEIVLDDKPAATLVDLALVEIT